MRKQIALLFLLLAAYYLQAQGSFAKQWDKRYGGISREGLTCLIRTSDNGYILGGTSCSPISSDKTQTPYGFYTDDYWIVKVDSMGNKEWDKTYGGSIYDEFSSVIQTTDGGYLLGGGSNSPADGDVTQTGWATGDEDYWVLKIDSVGNKQWDKRFGGNDVDYISSLQQTADGGYILGGSSYSPANGNKTQSSRGESDYWIVKLNSLGTKQWDKRFGGNSYEYMTSLVQTTDGGYMLGGHSFSDAGGDKTQANWSIGYNDYWIVKVNSFGVKQWDRRYGGMGYEKFGSLKQTTDGGYILAGISGSDISGDKTQVCQDTTLVAENKSDFWLVKVDSIGNKLWDKTLGGINFEDVIETIYETVDGGYLFGGISYSGANGDKSENNLGKAQAWIIKTNSTGNKQWDKTILTLGEDKGLFFVPLANGCITIGTNDNGDIGGYKTQANWDTTHPALGGRTKDYWIVKFCPDTNTSGSVASIENPQSSITLFPNPASTQLFIETSGTAIEQVNIYNTTGSLVMAAASIINNQLSIINLPQGIYIAEIKTNEGSVRKRWVKM